MLNLTIFRVKDHIFAYETESVLETVKVERIFRVPKAPNYIVGVLNLRNKVIPLIDMGSLLWSEKIKSDTAIILNVKGETIGILVDKVIGITQLEEINTKEKEEVSVEGIREDIVKSIIEKDGTIIFVVDLCPIIEVSKKGSRKLPKKEKLTGTKENIKKREGLKGYVIFQVADEWFAVKVDYVREIVDYPEHVSPIPKSPDYVEGVFLLRGEKIVLVSLSKIMGILPSKKKDKVIVFKIGNAVIGTPVDCVKEIKWIPENSILKLEGRISEGVIVLDEGSRLASTINIQSMLNLKDIETVIGDDEEKEKVETEVKNMKSFVRFNVGNIDMAIPIEKIKEVIEVEDLSPVPGTPQYVKGMYNLRNSVIVVIDLKKKLEINTEDDSNRVIVLENIPVGLVVTKLKGILRTEEENIQPAEGMAGVEESLLEGIIKTEKGEVIFILDIDKAIEEQDIKLIREELVKND